MRGFRGAITVKENTAQAIREASIELVGSMVEINKIDVESIGAAIFTATDDLTAAFPASGARTLPGFDMVPLFDARQMAVDDSLPKCIRVLILADSKLKQREIKHIYLGGAKKLRPDLK